MFVRVAIAAGLRFGTMMKKFVFKIMCTDLDHIEM